jgi:RNA-directed DNA polymerase
VDNGVFHETPTGTGQGSVISPLLANVALHGLEAVLGVRRRKAGGITGSRAVVRYADDFCVFCETEDDARAVVETLHNWLAARGLALSPEKTRIVHLDTGFDFLGFTIRQYPSTQTKTGRKVRITPSKASIQALRTKVDAIWKQYVGGPVRAVIRALNPVIRGWANYFRIGIASRIFSGLDNWMFLKAVRWVNRSHPHKPNAWRRARYWGRFHRTRVDSWVFGDSSSGACLLKFKWFRIERHCIVRGTASPDDPALRAYWATRQRAKTQALTPSRQRIALRQAGICSVCGETLFNDEELQIHHKVPRAKGGTDAYTNLELMHYYCHQHLHTCSSTREHGAVTRGGAT